MKILTPGHKYELDHFESYGLPGCKVETLQFIEKVPESSNPTNPKNFGLPDKHGLVTVHDGTTNEEVLAVLIDRLNFLNEKFPSPYNQLALSGLTSALAALNLRTHDRQRRDVEGKYIS